MMPFKNIIKVRLHSGFQTLTIGRFALDFCHDKIKIQPELIEEIRL